MKCMLMPVVKLQVDIFKLETLYLNALPLENVTSHVGSLFRILSKVDRKEITRQWLKSDIPTIDD